MGPDDVNQPADNSQGEVTTETVTEPPAGHPAWQEILDQLPEDLHPIVTPKLKEWDQGVQNKLQEVRSEYDPYKPLIEKGIDYAQVEQALGILNEIQSDPGKFLEEVNSHFELGYVPKTELEKAQQAAQQQAVPVENDPFAELGLDITKHPAFQAMQKQLEDVNGTLTKQQQEALEAEEEATFEAALEELREAHGDFDNLYVATLMSNGMDGETAVKQYQDTINQAAARIAGTTQTTEPTTSKTAPVVMGGAGVSGSGLPDTAVNVGAMGDSDIKQLVTNMLEAQSQQQ